MPKQHSDLDHSVVGRESDEPTAPQPRLLTRPQAATYTALSLAAFDDWVRRGLLPGALPGTHRWDKKAIDAAIDRASGLLPSANTETDYAAWKKVHAGSPAGDSHS